MTEASNRRRKDSAKLVWDTKPKRATNPRDIEFQMAEIVILNPKQDQGSFDLPLFAKPQAGATSLLPGQMGDCRLVVLNGTSRMPILAESPELSTGKRTIAVCLVDFFGNDASATVEAKT